MDMGIQDEFAEFVQEHGKLIERVPGLMCDKLLYAIANLRVLVSSCTEEPIVAIFREDGVMIYQGLGIRRGLSRVSGYELTPQRIEQIKRRNERFLRELLAELKRGSCNGQR